MRRFTGLIPPMVTPFRDGQVDADGIRQLVDHCVDHLDGMVVAGSCGEGPSMSTPQRLEAVRCFVKSVDGRVPVIMGASGTSLTEITGLIAEGERIGAAGFLVPAPFYFTNSAEALRGFYRAVAAATELEVLLYDNPAATKTRLPVELLAAIVEDNANINHLKMTDTDIDKVPALAERCDAALLAGSDEVMHHQVRRGCVGAVTAAPQVFPRRCRAWFDEARLGEGDAGRDHYDRLAPFVIELLQGPDQYPAVVKLALACLGVLPSDEVLPPLTPLDRLRHEEISALMQASVFEEVA